MLHAEKGIFQFDGSPSHFHEWEFRTKMKVNGAVEDKDRKLVASKVIEGLFGEALSLAMDLGTEALFEESGIEKLIARIKEHIFPNTRAEARELYHAGLREHGSLSRQNGESVVSYISRRRIWWTLLTKLDSEIQMSAKMRGELLMDLGGFTRRSS